MRYRPRIPGELLAGAVAIGNALALLACAAPAAPPVDDGPDAAVPDVPDAAPLDLFDLHDRARATCDAVDLAALTALVEARRGAWPIWDGGRALFVTEAPAAIAGAFNDWRADADATAPLCETGLATAVVAVPTGRWPYKLVAGDVWSLDPGNWAFAYDDHPGNADGKNSIVNTPDSGLGHLVAPPEPLCSDALGNCRRLTTYLPRGYADPANADRRYPVIFMHDGQNIFDDHDCCFGHTGWEVNVALDAAIAAGEVEETIVVGADHAGARRGDEYGWAVAAGGAQETFMTFQVEVVQPTAASRWRIDPARVFVAGSSLGGLVSIRLALAYPDVYAGAASLSGAFWPGEDTGTALADVLAATGKVEVPIYLDHGGTLEGGEDGAHDNVAIRDQMIALGWTRADSPACALAADALCYFHDVGASHDELAWRDRAWRFLRFLVGR